MYCTKRDYSQIIALPSDDTDFVQKFGCNFIEKLKAELVMASSLILKVNIESNGCTKVFFASATYLRLLLLCEIRAWVVQNLLLYKTFCLNDGIDDFSQRIYIIHLHQSGVLWVSGGLNGQYLGKVIYKNNPCSLPV